MTAQQPQGATKQTTREEAPKKSQLERIFDMVADPEQKLNLLAAAESFGQTEWGGKISQERRVYFEKIAREQGLSLAHGHVYILGGTFYISLQGRLKLADDSNLFDGFCAQGAVPKDEWAAWGIPADAVCTWKVSAQRRDQKYPMTEVGFAGGTYDQSQPVAKKNPGAMARTRAMARCLKYLFPIGMQSAEEATELGELLKIGNHEVHLPAEQVAVKGFYAAASVKGLTPDAARKVLEDNKGNVDNALADLAQSEAPPTAGQTVQPSGNADLFGSTGEPSFFDQMKAWANGAVSDRELADLCEIHPDDEAEVRKAVNAAVDAKNAEGGK